MALQSSFCRRFGDNVLRASHTDPFFFIPKEKNVQHPQSLCSAAFTNGSRPMDQVREGINVNILKEKNFSFSVFQWHACPCWQNWDGYVNFPETCHKFMQQQVLLNPWSNFKDICYSTSSCMRSSTNDICHSRFISGSVNNTSSGCFICAV